MSNNSATLPGLNLPATQDLLTNLEKFKKGFINYLQIKLDTGLFVCFFLCLLLCLFLCLKAILCIENTSMTHNL